MAKVWLFILSERGAPRSSYLHTITSTAEAIRPGWIVGCPMLGFKRLEKLGAILSNAKLGARKGREGRLVDGSV